MIVYRLARHKYARDLSGKGAELTGGRWNSRGVPMLYTGESRALCTVEVSVHVPLGIMPDDYHLIQILIPDELHMIEVDPDKLDDNWKSIPHHHSTQQIGDKWAIEKQSAILTVPSVVVPGDFNYLINPMHPDAGQIQLLKIEVFGFLKCLSV